MSCVLIRDRRFTYRRYQKGYRSPLNWLPRFRWNVLDRWAGWGDAINVWGDACDIAVWYCRCTVGVVLQISDVG